MKKNHNPVNKLPWKASDLLAHTVNDFNIVQGWPDYHFSFEDSYLKRGWNIYLDFCGCIMVNTFSLNLKPFAKELNNITIDHLFDNNSCTKSDYEKLKGIYFLQFGDFKYLFDHYEIRFEGLNYTVEGNNNNMGKDLDKTRIEIVKLYKFLKKNGC